MKPPLALIAWLLREDEALAGDLIEAAPDKPASWVWRQLLLSVAARQMQALAADPRASLERTLVSSAVLAVLVFSIIVAAGLLDRVAFLAGSDVSFPHAVLQLHAQVAPSFDVVSIKRNLTGQQMGGGLAAPQPGGRYIGLGVTVNRLITDAFGRSVRGGPEWIDTERFDINARAQGNPTARQIMAMLRPMLIDRFKLVVHVEAPEMAVYALTLARPDRRLGPGLRPSDAACQEEARTRFLDPAGGVTPQCGDFRRSTGTLTARAMTMAGLGSALDGDVGRPVVDRTGVDGAFDITLEWSDQPGGVSLATALREQLGLRLEATRAPIEVVVIDRVERPTPD